VETLKKDPQFCCFILHDVDLFPENQNHLYACSTAPRHMCSSLNTFRYNLMYRDLFGGVIAIRRDQFKRINGFSNMYWGWGGEDDDLSERITNSGLEITRWEPEISRFFMLAHKKEKPNSEMNMLLRDSVKRLQEDGLSSLRYKVMENVERPLFTKIVVDFSD